MEDIKKQPLGILDNVDLSEINITRKDARKFYRDMTVEECKCPTRYGIVTGWTENVIWPKEADWLCQIPTLQHYSDFEHFKVCRPTYSLHHTTDELTGKNIGIAVIYTEFNWTHPEYSENIAHYETLYTTQKEITTALTETALNASALVSTAVGKKCGAAPDSKLHYFAAPTDANANGHTDALKRVLEHNDKLPDNKKIRFLICPWNDKDKQKYSQQQQLLKQCEQNGIMIIGAGRDTFRKKLVTYSPNFVTYLREKGYGVSIDDHVVAHPNGNYVFLRYAGMPSAMACIAGGLACVVSYTPKFCTIENWQHRLIELTIHNSSCETDCHEFNPGNMPYIVRNEYERHVR